MRIDALRKAIADFNEAGQEGPDPLASLYEERRQSFSLFSRGFTHDELEALRPYVFSYGGFPERPEDSPIRSLNFIDGKWRRPVGEKLTTLHSHADDRVPLLEIATSDAKDVELAVDSADRAWKSLAWADETFAYRKWVVKNFSRLLDHYTEECLHEIRQQIPKTRLESQKDFFEAKRAADHLEGNIETALRGELVPPMVPGHTYWRDSWLPAGVAAVITPMNFIWGIPGIQIIGAYLSGCPFIYKGHPFAAATNTTIIRMLLASGADPRFVQKLEGFGKDVASLSSDKRVAVVSVTGASQTAKEISVARGIRRTRFEGGGCNWVWLDDGYSDDELSKIAERLTYAKLGFSSHKCTTLHGIAASRSTLDRLVPMLNAEMNRWEVRDPRGAGVNIVGPLVVHRAQTALDIVAAAKAAGVTVHRENARASGEWGQHAQAVTPAIIEIAGEESVEVDWDGRGNRRIPLATTEFFMPILVVRELDWDGFLRFCLFENPHDLATGIWSRDDAKLQRGRQLLGGMLKENDGTDSALEWEEFGASTVGESGNMGVGEVQATLSIFCRKQKGRHLVF